MKKRQKFGVSLFGGLILGLVLFAVNFYQNFNRISAFPVTAWTEDHKADCGVVLTGGPNRLKDAFEQLYLKAC